jgi:hypothetical protein
MRFSLDFLRSPKTFLRTPEFRRPLPNYSKKRPESPLKVWASRLCEARTRDHVKTAVIHKFLLLREGLYSFAFFDIESTGQA